MQTTSPEQNRLKGLLLAACLSAAFIGMHFLPQWFPGKQVYVVMSVAFFSLGSFTLGKTGWTLGTIALWHLATITTMVASAFVFSDDGEIILAVYFLLIYWSIAIAIETALFGAVRVSKPWRDRWFS